MPKENKSQTPAQKQLIQALDEIFMSGAWEIPGDAVGGTVMASVNALKAKVDFLSNQVLAMRTAMEGKSPAKVEPKPETKAKAEPVAAPTVARANPLAKHTEPKAKAKK